jgi:Amt family ammonium transporter
MLWLSCLFSVTLFVATPVTLQAEEEAPVTVESLLSTGLITQAEIDAFKEAGKSLDEIQEQVDYKKEYMDMVAEHGFHGYAFNFFVTSMIWTVISAALVFLMHLGFATVESGLTRSKNTTNVLFKNVFVVAIGIVTYALVGYNTHYPGDNWIIDGLLAFGGPIGDLNENFTFGYGGVGLAMTGYGDFIFQAMFAATAATIVSGAVAERIKLGSFMVFALILVAIGYPIAGSWHWGGGFLSNLGDGERAFKDFAGSSAVHAFGGFAALAAVIVLGPRAGRYLPGGKIKAMPGHSMPLATIGVLLLWLGWFGFNGGSVLSAEPKAVGLVFTTTALAAAAGALGSIVCSWIFIKKPDLSMALNGILAGLVGITAGADAVSPWAASLIGFVAGIIVVFSIVFFDSIKIDDPVGAISVHGVCGVFGTVVIAFFNDEIYLSSQIIGTLAFGGFAFIFSLILALIIKAIMGFRVSAEDEQRGLDLSEHGLEAYPDFGTVNK